MTIFEKPKNEETDFYTDVRIGEDLDDFASEVDRFGRRNLVSDILSSCRDEDIRVNIVFGLRRTGKTVAMLQAIHDMDAEERGKTAYILVNKENTFRELRLDLKKLEEMGFVNVFIDEVTFLEDFIDCSSVFYDYFAETGMKVFLSGTDSLSFVLSARSELFDRYRKIPTTWIPFFEYSRLKGETDIDTYLECGGVLSDFVVKNDDSGNGYIYTAIADNIQNSLEYYRDGMKFGSLHDLYNHDELRDAIVRFVQDKNHRFVERVFNKMFKSSDFNTAMKNLSKSKDADIQESFTRISKIVRKPDIERITANVMSKLGMKVKKTKINEFHVQEMDEHFKLLDFVVDCPQKSHRGLVEMERRNLLQQQGIRHLHLDAVIDAMSGDETFLSMTPEDQILLVQRVLDTAHGLMLEDVVLLDTLHSLPETCKMFTYDLPVGEFDMVVDDKEARICHIVEIKHGIGYDKDQHKHVGDPENVALIARHFSREYRYEKHVIYQGSPGIVQDGRWTEEAFDRFGRNLGTGMISYVNAKDYLLALADIKAGQNYSDVLENIGASTGLSETESFPKP